MKRLFLAAEGGNPESIKKLEKFAGGLKGKSIAYIPTASNGENPYDFWKTGSEIWKVLNTLEVKVEAVSLEEYKNSSVLEHLRGKDIIWVGGGMCSYLMYWIRRCEIDKHIDELLYAGSIYVGSSAGSMICAKTLDIAEAFLGECEHGAKIIPGLGLIDFDIYPHYEETTLPEIKKVWKGGDLYLLKNDEAITIEDDRIEVLGEKRILRDGKVV